MVIICTDCALCIQHAQANRPQSDYVRSGGASFRCSFNCRSGWTPRRTELEAAGVANDDHVRELREYVVSRIDDSNSDRDDDVVDSLQ